ncbi:MAG: family transposase [Planctomycetaceae bacterium]|nr:family transposase [Planctomycetaceae bacterium]
MNTPQLEVADVFREHGDEYLRTYGATAAQRQVLRAVQNCRTAVLGGHVEACDRCGHQQIAYNSCRNRHCPKCQGPATARWLQARAAELLPVGYFHLVFTLPSVLGPLALQNPRVVYDLLLQAAAQTLSAVAATPKHLGAEIGFLAVLHTWGQNLMHHSHVHCVIPAGGLAPNGVQWVHCRKGFFLPVRVLSRVFRGKFVSGLKQAFVRGDLRFHGELAELTQTGAFEGLLNQSVRHDWVVYAKRPFGGPQQVLKYLARYTHRVAISNRRLISFAEGKVTFRWKDYAHADRVRLMTLSAIEFIRRFLLHVLPKGFVKIRHYGFMANRFRRAKLELCRRLLQRPDLAAAEHDPVGELRETRDGDKVPRRCPHCGEVN